MTERLKELMLELVQTNNGITDVSLSLKLMSSLNPTAFTTDEFLLALHQLLLPGELLSLRYHDPASNRAKMLLFIKGTVFLEVDNGQRPPTCQEEVAR